MADYPNRTDLQNPAAKMAATAAKGQAYGEAGAQIASQQAVPMGAPPTDAIQRPAPGSMGSLTRPTERPAEPITAGADFGAGPTMAQAGIATTLPGFNDTLEELKVLFRQFPNDDLAGLLSALQYEGS